MKTISNEFREALRGIREIDTKITYKNNGVDTIIENETIKSVNPLFKVDLFRTICKSVQIESQQDIPLKTWINLEIGVLVNNNYEYLDFGKYYIIDSTFQADTNTYLITAYDKMIESMIKYDENPLEITYPISIKDMLVKVCEKLNWQYNLETFVNDDKLIKKDLFSGLGLTYRDILDNLSEVAVGNLTFDNNDNLIIKYIDKNNPTDWNENQVVTEEDLKSVNVDIKTKYGKINTLLISSNNVVLNNITDEQSVTQNGKTEIKIDDNLILIFENEQFIEEMFDYVNGLEFYLYDFDTIGLLFLEPLDKFAVRIDNVYYPTICLNDDIKITSGLVETLYVEEPEINVNEYIVNDKETSKLNQTAIRIDKQNQEIELIASKTEESTKTLKTDKSVESSGEIITIEDSGGYDLEKLRIDGKTGLVEKITKKSIIEVNGEFDLNEKTLSVDFGNYTSDEILTSLFGSSNYAIEYSMTQLGRIGVIEGNQTVMIVASNPNILNMLIQDSYGVSGEIDRNDLQEDKYYIFAMDLSLLDSEQKIIVKTLANISSLEVYSNYKIPICQSNLNEIIGYTMNLVFGNQYVIPNDDIIWGCLLVNFATHSFGSLGQNGSIEIEINNGVDTQTTTIELTEPLRSLDNGTKDTYENGVITRRIGMAETGELYELDELITEDVGFLSIPTFKGLNNISLNSNIPTNFGITYLTNSELNGIYATKSALKITSNEITSNINANFSTKEETDEKLLEMNNTISQKITDETNEINLSVENKLSGVSDDDGNVTSASLLLAINDDKSETSIKSDKISLEGYTTINGGFTIDEYGNPTIKLTDEATDFGIDAKLDIIGTESQTQVNSFGVKTEWYNSRGYKNNCYLGTNNILVETEGNSYDTEAMLYSDEESATLSLQLYDQNGNPYNGFRINVFPEKKVRITNQNGGELFMEHTLYENSSGSNGTITLSESANNFEYLEIFYKDFYNNSPFQSVKVPNSNGKKAQLAVIGKSGSALRMTTTQIGISGTTLTPENYGIGVNNSSAFYNSNEVVITKVIGYK